MEPSSPFPPLDPAVAAHVAGSYPHNHDYRVVHGELRPSWKLRRRERRLRALYPEPLTDLVDLACSKGWFCLQAARTPGCERVLGVDLFDPDLDALRAVRDHLGVERLCVEKLLLHEVAERIDELGGPFQTALLVNVYPYLYFGSGRSERHYADHAEIFGLLRRVCSGHLVFSNRVELERCPHNVRERARAQGRGADFTEEAIRAAAAEHFAIEPRGHLGRIPLWSLRAR